MKNRVFSILLTIFVLSVFVSVPVFAEDIQQATIPEGKATIDGVVSGNEWKEATTLNVEMAVTKDCKEGQCTDGASAVSYHAMWDENYLYLLVEVTDDQLVVNENTGTSYRNDCLFVYVGEDVDSHGDYSDTTYMLCLFPYFDETDYDSFNENGNSGTIICRNGTHDVSMDSYKCKVTGDATKGYTIVMEAAISWNDISPKAGDSIAFDLQYNDANSDLYGFSSNNREAIWSWSAVGGDNKGPNVNKGLWGELELKAVYKATATPTKAPTKTPTKAPDTTPTNAPSATETIVPSATATMPTETEQPPVVTPSTTVERTKTPGITMTKEPTATTQAPVPSATAEGTENHDENPKSVLPIIIIVIVILAVGGGVAFFLLKKKK